MLRALLLGIGLSLLAPAAQAAILVTFNIGPNASGTPLGPISGSFELHGDPEHHVPLGPGVTLDFYGYRLDQIRNFTPIVFEGVTTFGQEHIIDRIVPSSPFSDATGVWLGWTAALTPRVSLLFENDTHTLTIGHIGQGAGVWRIFQNELRTIGGDLVAGSSCCGNHQVTVTPIAAIPVPAALPFMATVLAGLGLIRMGRRRAA